MYIVLETPPPHPCMYMYVEYASGLDSGSIPASQT